jgi:hypothetical protein
VGTGYATMYRDEREAHDRTRADLARSKDLVATFREYLRLKSCEREFLEWLLARHLGDAEAKKFMEESQLSRL